MSLIRALGPVAVVAIIVATSLRVVAEQTPYTTDAEQLARQLRKAPDRAAQLKGERWYGLVKLQEWTDASGKFTTTAKYVEHDPDLKWVKLRVERTTDGRREVKDVTVPWERLSKTCQSRVRQIAALEQKVREAVAAAEQAAQTAAQERQSEQAGEGRRPSREGYTDEEGQQQESEQPGEGREVLGPEERGEPAEMSRGDSPRRGRRPSGRPMGPSPPPDAWRTSYDEFRENFTVGEDDAGQYQVDWGTLTTLQQVHDAMQSHFQRGSVPGLTEAAGLAGQLASAGEFTWETKLTKPVADDDKWAERLDLAPLPEPLSLELRLDQDSGNWQRFKVGDRVRLTGRFIAFAGQYKIVAAIRFPDGPPSEGQPPRGRPPAGYGRPTSGDRPTSMSPRARGR